MVQPKAGKAKSHHVPIADLQEQIGRLKRERDEALQQQAATSEVLEVISSSPGELRPVFQAILESATRICGAKFGMMYHYTDNAFYPAAMQNVPPAYESYVRKRGWFLPRGYTLNRLLQTKQVIHNVDEATVQPPTPSAEFGGSRSQVTVPMLKENTLIGAIAIYRQEVRPFSDSQVELVKNFAAQAVIAIENTRLLNELRESLEQQTATADVLGVISSSRGDLEPVFQSMLVNGIRLCEAKFGIMWLCEGDEFRCGALHNAPPALAELRRREPAIRPHAESPLGRAARTKQVVHIPDVTAGKSYAPSLLTAGARTVLAVPMLKDDELVGVITIYRQEVRPFTDKQIELVKNFAAQAVIAIENTRLLKELRERTDQLEAQSQEVVNLNQQLERRVAEQVGEIERMGRLRRFLTPQVADLIIASGTEKQLESHRREITALFCDLRGFTGFSERSDPEDVMSLLREYHAAVGEIITKYSGTLEHYAGDGVMVFFNDPIPVPNSALQAVQTALDMRTAIGALTEKWRRLGHELGFGIGIAHGFATLGTIGFEGRFDYAAIGTVSNVASRLCDEAKPGQILISPRVLMTVEDAVTVEPVGEFALKGILRPIAAYNVLSAGSSKIDP